MLVITEAFASEKVAKCEAYLLNAYFSHAGILRNEDELNELNQEGRRFIRVGGGVRK